MCASMVGGTAHPKWGLGYVGAILEDSLSCYPGTHNNTAMHGTDITPTVCLLNDVTPIACLLNDVTTTACLLNDVTPTACLLNLQPVY